MSFIFENETKRPTILFLFILCPSCNAKQIEYIYIVEVRH